MQLVLSEELPTKDGYTWTINSRLGDTLKKAEELFGQRDKDYTILGVEFVLHDIPSVWYPGDCNHILIRLSKDALYDFNQALYQLSHETVHCLSPKPGSMVNVLEEGLATYFSEWYMQNSGFGNWFSTNKKYTAASDLVKDLLSTDCDVIKKIRKIQPVISDISSDDFLWINPELDEKLIQKLCMPWK